MGTPGERREALVIGIGFAFFITRSITRPVGEVSAAAKKMAGGDFNFDLKSDAKDEVGDVVRAVADVQSSVKRMIADASMLSDAAVAGKLSTRADATKHQGDFGRIVVKDGANIQDNCVMHGFPGQDTVVEEEGHIGHGAILHGCVIGRNALVGMSAVIIDGAVIGENSIVGASAFVKANAEMPANHLIIGSPAKAIRTLSEQELAWKKQGTREYQVLVERCKQTLHQVEPLREVEAGRKRLEFDENLRPKTQR